MTTPVPDPLAEFDVSALDELAAERDRVTRTLELAETQHMDRLAAAWRAGSITWPDLYRAYEQLRSRKVVGTAARWTAAGLPLYSRIWQTLARPDMPRCGYWFGGESGRSSAHNGHVCDARPADGDSVVYVLFDVDLTPIYVGSTHRFTTRMAEHRTGGRRWESWVAYPCQDRQHAYEVEGAFLERYMPAGNKRRERVRR